MNELEQEARRIVNILLLWAECDEFHIHTGPGKNADPDDGHKSFDDDQATAAIMELVRKGQREERVHLAAEVATLNTRKSANPWIRDPIRNALQDEEYARLNRDLLHGIGSGYEVAKEDVLALLHPSDSQKGKDHA